MIWASLVAQMGKESACNGGDTGSILDPGRSSGEGNGNQLQYSCLENSMDREAWWTTVYGVTKSQTQLNDFHTLRVNIHANSSLQVRAQLD